MKILVKHLKCGDFGSIIDCYAPRIFCPFCKERTVVFEEKREVTPIELYDLINRNQYIIELLK